MSIKKSYKIYLLLFSIIAGQFAFGQCAITLVENHTNNTCSGCNNGTASVSVSGGTAPYTYVWTNNVAAGTANIVAAKDNSIYQQSTGNSNGAGDYFVAGETGAGFKNRALLAFDITGNIPAGALITNANLKLFVYSTSGTTGPKIHLLHRLGQDWGEGSSFATQPGQGAPATTNDATWIKNFFPGSNWTISGSVFDPVESAAAIVDAAQSFYNWSSPAMVTDVQGWLNTPSSNFGWLLKSEEAGPKEAKRYASKENGTSAWRPVLTVSYGPAVVGTTSSVSNLSPGTYTVTVTDVSGCTATTNVTITAPVTLPNIICTDLVLSSNNTYLIDGKVYVQCGATLFINQGTILKAVKKSNPAEASALVITRSGRIDCQGTNVNPVIFTSNETVPASGDWGGIVILGSAPLNRSDTSIEGIDPLTVPPGVDIFYGGGNAGQGNPEHSSGIMRYARIEFAGTILTSGNALNSLTLGGVGRGTELDFIQTSYGAGDGFQICGGTLNATHLVALAPHDDALDFKYGYSGHLQFVVSVFRVSVPFYSSDPNGMETDNNGAISNITIIGMEDSLSASEFLPAPGSKRLLNAARLFNSGSNTIRNSIFMGFPAGVKFGVGSSANFQYNIVHGFRVTDSGASIDGTNIEYPGNVFNSNASIMLNDPFNLTSPDFRPLASSPAATGANFSGFTSNPPGFFQSTAYRGAFPATLQNWAASWSKFF